MKKSKKLLSILLAIVMVFSAIAVPASAAIPENVTTIEALVQPSNLAGLVEWLLTSLNSRKTNYADSVLNFVCAFVEDINAEVPEGTDVFNDNIATSTKATYVMNYLNKMLAEQNLNESLGEDILRLVNGIPGLTIDLNNINGILSTLASVERIKDVAGGHIAGLDLSGLVKGSGLFASAYTRTELGDLQIIYALIQFLYNNIDVFESFLNGTLNLGLIGTFAPDLKDQVNSYAGEITAMIKDLVYDSLLGAPDAAASHAESAYKNWTVDEMLIGALYKMLTDVAPAADKDFSDYLTTPLYTLLTDNADLLYDRFLLGWLQNDLVEVLKEFAQDNELAQYFNFDFTFTASEFNFKDAPNGILGEFNNVVVALLNKLLAQNVLAELQLENGDNSKLNANLEKVVKFVLPKMATVIDPAEFDFRMFTEEYVADKELPELAVQILKLFFPGWFDLDDAAIAVVNQFDTLAEAATMAIYYAVNKYVPDMFAEGNYDYLAEWDALIFEADGTTLKDLGNSQWNNICLTMAADTAMYAMALNGSKFYFDFDMDDIKAMKASEAQKAADNPNYVKLYGAEYLDEIADWAIGMIKGLPAVTDNLAGKRGQFDGNGPFYKLNVLLNEILNWSFLNNVSYASFNFDLETLLFDGILGNVYDFDIAGILGLFAVNNKEGNILNQNAAPAILSVVDNLLNILFAHKETAVTTTVAATCDEAGFSVKHCSKCGLYLEEPKAGAAATGHKIETEVLIESSCEEKGLVRYTCENCDYVSRKDTAASGHLWTLSKIEIDGVWYNNTVCANCEKTQGDLLPIPVPDKILIETAPSKVEYELNEEGEIDLLAGLIVKAEYAGEVDPYPIEHEELVVETDFDITVAGDYVVTISYLDCSVSFTVTVIDNSEPEYMLGDADCNGKIDSGDARATLRAAVGLEPLSEIGMKAADVDKNGKIDSADARTILRVSVGLDTLS